MTPIRDLARNVHVAFRIFTRHGPYWTATAILALGIGMSVAMFSLVDAVLLRPLPFPGQEAIQVIWKANPLIGDQVEELAYPELRDLQENIADFEYVAVMPTSLYGYGRVLQTGQAPPVEIESAPVSHDFFRVLGVSPAMGRDFTSLDEQVGAAPVVMISDRVWRERLSADRNIVGRMIRLNGQGHTVIGVMAPGVEFPRGAGLWIPLGVDRRVVESRGATFLQAIARLSPGRSRETIAGQVNGLFARQAADHPEAYSASQRAVVTPLVEYWTGSARLHLWIMLAASLLLLVAAAVSAGNLLLSRTLARQFEIATRLALGARHGQILSQLAAEGAAIAAIATVGGLLMAQAVVRLLASWAPADIPRLSSAALDLHSFGFASGAALFAAVACSLAPGWWVAHVPPDSALREGGSRSSMSKRSGRTRSTFVLVQAAVTTILLAMTTLLVQSYRSMMATDTGFANRDTVTMNVQLRGPSLFSAQAFDAAARRAFYARLLEHLRQAPGVTSAATVLLRPLEGTIGWDVSYQFEFETAGKENRVLPKANYEVVTSGYFQTVGTPLLEGRDFNEHDSADSESVVIISRTLAERIRASGYVPLGHRVRLGLGQSHWSKVIGVCSDARYRSITQGGADVFVSYLQAQPPTNYLVIRGAQPAAELAALVRRSMAELDPSQAAAGVATIGELIDRNMARHRFNMILLLWFGVCAAVLAATGVYSVIAESVAAREREVAIKTALGAGRPRLVREIVSGTLALVLTGEVLGVCCTALFGHAASDLLYGVSPHDPVMLGLVGSFLFLVSLLAAFWPAWIAASGDPRVALRAA
jgi:putative ABC transport system permease protein